MSNNGEFKVKVIVLSRNEYDLIEDFLTYYGALVGFENIVVIDNDSDDGRVLQIYKEFVSRGVTLEKTSKGMTQMSEIMTDAILRHRDTADFIIPVDTDEFLYFPSLFTSLLETKTETGTIQRDEENLIASSRTSLHAALRAAPDDIDIIRYKHVLASVPVATCPDYKDYKHQRPVKSITSFVNQGWDKLILRCPCPDFLLISQGNHHVHMLAAGNNSNSDTSNIRPQPRAERQIKEFVTSELGLLHFHDTGSARKRERCIMSMRGYFQFDAGIQNSPLEHQAAVCDEIIQKGVFGGHRVEQYREFVRKELICREFVRLFGNVPSPAAVDEIVRAPHAWERKGALATTLLARFPINPSKVNNSGMGGGTQAKPTSQNEPTVKDVIDLLYQEAPMPDEKDLFHIDQVSNMLP